MQDLALPKLRGGAAASARGNKAEAPKPSAPKPTDPSNSRRVQPLHSFFGEPRMRSIVTFPVSFYTVMVRREGWGPQSDSAGMRQNAVTLILRPLRFGLSPATRPVSLAGFERVAVRAQASECGAIYP